MNDKVRKFSKATREVDDLAVEALEKFGAYFVHANDKPELSEKALEKCMALLEEAGTLIGTLHDMARIELTGNEEPQNKDEYKLRMTRWTGPEDSPPFVIDLDL